MADAEVTELRRGIGSLLGGEATSILVASPRRLHLAQDFASVAFGLQPDLATPALGLDVPWLPVQGFLGRHLLSDDFGIH
jgi:hypothetical protein